MLCEKAIRMAEELRQAYSGRSLRLRAASTTAAEELGAAIEPEALPARQVRSGESGRSSTEVTLAILIHAAGRAAEEHC